MAEETYATHDLYLAAYLRVKGVKHLSTERPTHRAEFLFQGSEASLRKLIDAYFDDSGLVPPSRYAMELRHLKTVLHRV